MKISSSGTCIGNYSSFAIEPWIHINWNSHRALAGFEMLCDHSSAKEVFQITNKPHSKTRAVP